MFVPFESLPPVSRVWVFQANRTLSRQETAVAEAQLRSFTDQWAVHGSPLNTSYGIRYNQFIVLAADESSQSASGCSIDSSVRVLKQIEERLAIDLFDRNQVAFLSGHEVTLWPLRDLKEKFASGILSADSLTFNNLVDTKRDLDEKWLVPAGDTWLKRYIPNALSKVQ